MSNKTDRQWGNLGLTKSYLCVPEVLLLHFKDLGLTPNDVVFIQTVIMLKNRNTVPYACHIPLYKDAVTACKKRLVTMGLMVDKTVSNPANSGRAYPRYDFTPLFERLAGIAAKQEDVKKNSEEDDMTRVEELEKQVKDLTVQLNKLKSASRKDPENESLMEKQSDTVILLQEAKVALREAEESEELEEAAPVRIDVPKPTQAFQLSDSLRSSLLSQYETWSDGTLQGNIHGYSADVRNMKAQGINTDEAEATIQLMKEYQAGRKASGKSIKPHKFDVDYNKAFRQFVKEEVQLEVQAVEPAVRSLEFATATDDRLAELFTEWDTEARRAGAEYDKLTDELQALQAIHGDLNEETYVEINTRPQVSMAKKMLKDISENVIHSQRTAWRIARELFARKGLPFGDADARVYCRSLRPALAPVSDKA